MSKPYISVVVPVLNEAGHIEELLHALCREATKAFAVELIVVDGGSHDATCHIVRSIEQQDSRVRLLMGPKGRARQMNRGARAATGQWLVFLHADSCVPNNFFSPFIAFSSSASGNDSAMCYDKDNDKGKNDDDSNYAHSQGSATLSPLWGRYNVRLGAEGWQYRMIAAMMNWRSRVTGIATGDQAIFVRRETFVQVGGFPDQPLMEDIALSRLLKPLGRPVCVRFPVITTSARKWQQHGVWRTIFLMWRLRAAYALGASPDKLVRQYYS